MGHSGLHTYKQYPTNIIKKISLLFIAAGIMGYCATGQIIVKDIFNRTLNNYQITLVDWQGMCMNPMIKLTLCPPTSGVNYPLSVTVKAKGSSRLMLDLPSSLSETGATKTIYFNNADSCKTVYLAIAPDRVGGNGEFESYSFTLSYGIIVDSIPIKVLDMDDNLNSSLPLIFDYRFDDINFNFNKPGYKTASEAAINDWFYYFDFSSFDSVLTNDENLSLPGNDWKNHINVTNDKPYNGYWIFQRCIDSPYSTGFPSNNGKFHKKNGNQIAGPLHRSSALIIHTYPNANVFTSIADDDWYKTDPYQFADIYGLSIHEFGHSIIFHDSWAGYQNYKLNFQNVQSVSNYQGLAVPVDNSAHIPEDIKYWDRISGQSAGWNSLFPQRRWMITKLSLLIAEQVGWKLRDIGPFLRAAINTSSLPKGFTGQLYNTTLTSNGGGVPFYEWSIINGALPTGLLLNSFTGEISGKIAATAGTYDFTVQLRDYDEKCSPVIKTLTIVIEDPVDTCSAPSYVLASLLSSTSADVTWPNSNAKNYFLYYQATNGPWILACNGTVDNHCSLTELTPNMNYIVWVNSVCESGNYGKSNTFYTQLTTDSEFQESEKELINDISVNPNPVNEILEIKGLKNNGNYTITSLTGNIVIQDHKETINVSHLPSGLYFLRIGNKNYKLNKN